MKRDLNLVREILLRLEPLSANPDEPVALTVGERPLDIPNYTNQQIVYHIRIMHDGGLINYNLGLTGPGGVRIARFGGLRWQGHEFLDDVRDPKIWRATKKVLGKVGDASVQMAWEVAKQQLREQLGL